MRRPVTEIAKEIKALEMQGIPLTFRKKNELLYDQDVLNGKMSVKEAYGKMIGTKSQTTFLEPQKTDYLPDLQIQDEVVPVSTEEKGSILKMMKGGSLPKMQDAGFLEPTPEVQTDPTRPSTEEYRKNIQQNYNSFLQTNSKTPFITGVTEGGMNCINGVCSFVKGTGAKQFTRDTYTGNATFNDNLEKEGYYTVDPTKEGFEIGDIVQYSRRKGRAERFGGKTTPLTENELYPQHAKIVADKFVDDNGETQYVIVHNSGEEKLFKKTISETDLLSHTKGYLSGIHKFDGLLVQRYDPEMVAQRKKEREAQKEVLQGNNEFASEYTIPVNSISFTKNVQTLEGDDYEKQVNSDLAKIYTENYSKLAKMSNMPKSTFDKMLALQVAIQHIESGKGGLRSVAKEAIPDLLLDESRKASDALGSALDTLDSTYNKLVGNDTDGPKNWIDIYWEDNAENVREKFETKENFISYLNRDNKLSPYAKEWAYYNSARSKGAFQQKELSERGRFLSLDPKLESYTDQALASITLMMDNYHRAKKKYPDATEEELLDLSVLMHNAPSKAMTPEFYRYFVKNKDVDYVNEVKRYVPNINIEQQKTTQVSEDEKQKIVDFINSLSDARPQMRYGGSLPDLPKYQNGEETDTPTKRDIRRNTKRPETRAESEFYRQFSIGRYGFSDQSFIEDKDKIEWKGQPETGRLYPDISEQYPEVDYKGDRHWNIKRFAYEPQIVGGYAGSHVYNTVDGGINPQQLPESTKDRKNLLLQDIYKYNLADPDMSRREAWRESKKFMRKEIDPLINSRYHKFNEMGVGLGRSDSMRNWFDSIDTYNKQGYSDDPAEQRMTGYRGNNRQISKREALRGLKEFNRDFRKQSRKEARENARKELNEWENNREKTKESIEKGIQSNEINIAGKDSDRFQDVYGDSNWSKRDVRSLERLQKRVDRYNSSKFQNGGLPKYQVGTATAADSARVYKSYLDFKNAVESSPYEYREMSGYEKGLSSPTDAIVNTALPVQEVDSRIKPKSVTPLVSDRKEFLAGHPDFKLNENIANTFKGIIGKYLPSGHQDALMLYDYSNLAPSMGTSDLSEGDFPTPDQINNMSSRPTPTPTTSFTKTPNTIEEISGKIVNEATGESWTKEEWEALKGKGSFAKARQKAIRKKTGGYLPKYQDGTNSFPQVTDEYGNKGTRVKLIGDIDQDTGEAYTAYAPLYSLPEATATAKLDRTNPTAVKNWSRINDPIAYAAREATENVANNYLYPIAEVTPGIGDVADAMYLGKAIKDRDLTAMGFAATAAALPYVTYGALRATKPYRDYAEGVIRDYRAGIRKAKKQGISTMPLSSAEKKISIKAQDEALKEGVGFTQDWFYPTQSKLIADESGKIRKMVSKHKLRETPERKIMEILNENEGGSGLKNISSTAFNFKRKDSPLFQKENILMETHTLPILSSNVSRPVKEYLLKERGKILGANFYDGPSVTLRNQGFYRIPKNRLKKTVIHETGHTAQELGYDMAKIPGFNLKEKHPVTWGEGIAHIPEGYKYPIPNPRTESGRLAEKVMVDPVKGKNYNWNASPLEVHSDLMPLRENLVSDMVKNGWEYDDAIEWLQKNEATQPNILEYYRKSLSNFWKPGAKASDIDAFLKTLPAVGGVGLGLKMMNEKEDNQIQ